MIDKTFVNSNVLVYVTYTAPYGRGSVTAFAIWMRF